ncbi:Multidrug resistance protein B [Raoultella terrigena]|uniref:Multidrug resistance protein B n=1 Tax=Raoultella terrigena TaxID=577 RepID=A0A4U9D1T4_RAOTE|nr:Multidrug resistance protein B [Raoultella terrigena]
MYESNAREIALDPVNKLINGIIQANAGLIRGERNATAKPLEGAQLVIMTIALSLATFMQVLDSTIANVAIPTIAGNLGLIPEPGHLGDYLVWGGQRHLHSDNRLAGKTRGGSEAVPVVDGGVCHRLLGLRHVQQPDDADFLPRDSGIVAGPLIPLSQSLLLSNYPPAKRSIALALWSMTVIVAPICGPILGGYISDNYHWGWIFFINVPIGYCRGGHDAANPAQSGNPHRAAAH